MSQTLCSNSEGISVDGAIESPAEYFAKDATRQTCPEASSIHIEGVSLDNYRRWGMGLLPHGKLSGKSKVTGIKSMNTYTALNISDKYTPNAPKGVLSCIMSMLSSYSHYGFVHRRISQQLRARTEDCWACWDATNISLELVISVSTIIMKNMGWPNNFYIPQDPVKLLLLSSFTQLDINATLLDLEKSFGVDLFDDDSEKSIIDLRFEELLRYINARKGSLGSRAPRGAQFGAF